METNRRAIFATPQLTGDKIALMKLAIRADKDEEKAVIDIDGVVGSVNFDGEEIHWNTYESVKRQLKEIANLRANEIEVNINSPGGFVSDGFAIRDALAQHPAKVTTNIYGHSASAATIIAQAGDVRRMSSNALYLIHRSWGFSMGNIFDMIEVSEHLELIDNNMAEVYEKASSSGKSKQDYMDLMDAHNGAGKWLNSEDAIDWGLIDEEFEPASKAAASTSLELLKSLGLPFPGNAYISNHNYNANSNRNDTDRQIVEQVRKTLAL